MSEAALQVPNAGESTYRHIVARIERLPVCSWHNKMRAIFGTAWFFDAFDSLAIATVLPVLIGLWKLNPAHIGQLIAIGFAGQLIGSIAAGWLAERWGRIPTAILTLLIFTVMSFACAFAWSYDSLFWFRFVQGLGLGGEVPIMAAYVNEFAKAERRGRFSLGIQVLFAIGLPAVSLVGIYVVPNWGWQWMFIIGAVPALIAFPLRTLLPESPRWLASRGRFEEADRSLKVIEAIAQAEGKSLPPLPANLPEVEAHKTRFADLFKGFYSKRTVTLWCIWVCTYIITYGLTTWAPSLFRTVYKLPLQQSLIYGFVLTGTGLVGAILCTFLIDPMGRKKLFLGGLFLGSLPLLAFAFHPDLTAPQVLAVVCSSFLFITILALGLATYTAESYPTQLRALGGGVAGAWQRGASMLGPLLVGFIIPRGGPDLVFVVFGCFALAGAIIMALFAHETGGKVLENVSPPA